MGASTSHEALAHACDVAQVKMRELFDGAADEYVARAIPREVSAARRTASKWRARARECRCASSTCQALSKFKFKLHPHKNFHAVWSNKGGASRAKLAVWSVALEHKVSEMRIA